MRSEDWGGRAKETDKQNQEDELRLNAEQKKREEEQKAQEAHKQEKETRLKDEEQRRPEEQRRQDNQKQKKADIKTEDMNKNAEVQRNQDERKTGRRKHNFRKKRNSKVKSYTTSYRADKLIRGGGMQLFRAGRREQEKEDIVTLITIQAEVKRPSKNWKSMSPEFFLIF
ncbi:Hypothetical predicted protein [Mytilus galloprovincialis]|uniref:Uncharacterized protein n=1 Tax=Mytilus galloprovincialis TaxID=29158 RepID=A0A8B6FBS1_MYTGA|nr:Hypothetical predicted protein [Mytilus galloprovincialis]